jgi:superfamily II DNA helicase RecQ
MNKSLFIKEFQMSRRLQRVVERVEVESDEEYECRVRIARYGIEGEDRANYQLKNVLLPIVVLSDLRIDEEYGSAQADFIVINKSHVYIIEVKNLFGSVRVNTKGDVIRIIPRKTHVEEEGMENPFTQTKRQARIFERLLKDNGYNHSVDILIVMGNPRTAIYQEESQFPIIRYDQLNAYFTNKMSKYCTTEEYDKMIEIGEFVLSRNKERDFNDFNIMKKKFEDHNQPLPKFNEKDMKLYEEILECRRKISKVKKIPICNIFLNRDAENMVIYKPKNKEEFIKIPGIKLRKFLLCGQEIIEIIKRYIS